MKTLSWYITALAVLAAPLQAHGDWNQLFQPPEQLEQHTVSASVKERSRSFPALSVLPQDTDSFLAVSRVGELASLLVSEQGFMPWADMVEALDGMAVGITKQGVQDLHRMLPLFQVLAAEQNEAVYNWESRANAAAARAIVAVQREESAAAGEKLIRATKNFHLSPIYVTLTAKPGNESLLQQLSVLPLMLPMGTDAPIEMTVRSGWRGFCVCGSMLDLSDAELAPEHEAAIQENLENARLYVLARTVGNKLVLVICSNVEEVKIPAKSTESVLGAPLMGAFDAYLSRKPLLASYSSPDVVRLRESLNLYDYQYVAAFMKSVFQRLSKENAACAAAAESVQMLLDAAAKFIPSPEGAERAVVWEDDDMYLHLVSQAGAWRYTPAALQHTELAALPDTALYVESAPLTGGALPDIPTVLKQVETIQQGYQATLNTPEAGGTPYPVFMLGQHRAALESLAAGLQQMGAATVGSSVLWVQEAPSATAGSGCRYLLRSDLNDATTAEQTRSLLQQGCSVLFAGAAESPQVGTNGGAVYLSSGGAVPVVSPSAGAVNAVGGTVFSMNVPTMARVVESASAGAEAKEAAAFLHQAAGMVDRVKGCMRTVGDSLHTVMKLELKQQNQH